MKSIWLVKGAQILVDRCAGVKAGEKVAIVTDSATAMIAEAIAAVCHDRGADAVVLVMKPRRHDEEELPPVVAAAMASADVVFTPTLMGTAHTDATRAALAAGARVLCLDAFTDELMTSGGIFADFAAIQPLCHRVRDAFTAAREARVTSPGGTDIWLNLEGRDGNSHDGVCTEPGVFTAVPNIEVNISPVDGQGDGSIVIDGSVPHFGIGVVIEPIRLEVEEGYVTRVEGGREAEILARAWREAGDRNARLIAQLAVGLNPLIRQLTGTMLNDHGAWGTGHFGIGTSLTLGGVTRAPTHLDGIFWHPTIELDGEKIVEEGEVLLPEAKKWAGPGRFTGAFA